MTTNILINNISGASPFNIYLCDPSNITCIYIDTIPSSSLPYDFVVPVIMGSQNSFSLKVVDSNSCTFYQNLTVVEIVVEYLSTESNDVLITENDNYIILN
jgi:hypothetical protein